MADDLGSLGVMSVGFKADLDSLNSAAQQAASIMQDDLATSAQAAGTAMTESLTMPESAIADLMEAISGLGESLSEISSNIDLQTSVIDSGFADMGVAAQEAADQISASMSESSDAVSSAADRTHQSASLFSGGLMGMAQQAFMSYMSMQGLAQGALNLAQTLLAPAASAEQTGVAFDTLLHSTSKATAFLAQLNTFAAKTPFQTDAINEAAEKMVAFGFSTQQTIPYITAIGDSLSDLGKASDANLSSVVDIFGKIQAQGHVSAMDMMQLSSYGIPAWNLLAKAMGLSVTQVQELSKQGKLTSDVVLPALVKGMEQVFGGGMAKQATTMTGLMSTLASNAKLALDSFLGVQGGQVVKGSLFDTLEKGLTAVGNLLASPQFQKEAQQIGGDVSKALSQIETVLSHTDFSSFKTDLSDVWGILQEVGGVIGTVARDLYQFGSGLLSAANNSGDIQTVLVSIRDILPHVDDFLNTVGTDLNQNVLPPLESLITNVENAVARFAQWLDTSGAAKNTLSNLGDALGTVATVAGTLIGWLSGLIGWLTSGGPQTYIFAGAIGTLAAAFVGLKIADTVSGFASLFAQWNAGEGIVANLANALKDKLGAAIDKMLAEQFPNLKADLDATKAKADDAGTSMEDMGTKADEAATETDTAAAEMETDLEGVGTAADESATEMESIGATAQTDAEEVAASSTEMEASVEGVGASAEATSGEMAGVGEAATAAEGGVATAASGMIAALGPVAIAIAAVALNFNHFQEDASNPAWASSVGENIKNGLLDGLAPFSGLGNIKAMWDDFTSHIEGKTLDMETVLQGVKGVMDDMSNHVAKDTVTMKNTIVDQTNDMSQDVRGAFANMADNSLTSTLQLTQKAQDLFKQFTDNATLDFQNLDQSTIQYMDDTAAYIEQKSAEAADAANANFARINHFTPGLSKNLTNDSPFPGHASGIIDNPVGHIAVVGENGPELMYVPQGASIYPAGSYPTPAMYSAMSGGSAPEIHIHNHLYIDSMEMADMVGSRILKMASHSGPVRKAA
jgi:tape measure domain-containing protein